jgi:tRNA G46 methylase TrmB
LGGTRLLEAPEHRALAAHIARFLEPSGPVILEIGFDRGGRLLALARQSPGIRFLGVEIKKERARLAALQAPDNALLLALDARTLLSAAIPAGRLDRVDVLFPTPALRGRHLLWTPDFVELVAAALAPGGTLWLQTDVPALYEHAILLLQGWTSAEPPPADPVPSRRALVCARDEVPVFSACLRPRRL